jgi:hypothetical protein
MPILRGLNLVNGQKSQSVDRQLIQLILLPLIYRLVLCLLNHSCPRKRNARASALTTTQMPNHPKPAPFLVYSRPRECQANGLPHEYLANPRCQLARRRPDT